MNLKKLSDSELLSTTKRLVSEERRITIEILWHLREIERRQLFAERGFASLYDYATQELGYSPGAASRRIQSMRLLRDVPDVEEAIQSGKVTLTTASALQTFIRQDERIKHKKYSAEQKRDLFGKIQGMSKTECEKLFVSISPEAAAQSTGERERVVSPEFTEIKFLADQELMTQLKRIRELTAHRNPDPTYLELFKYLAAIGLRKLDPEKRPAGQSAPPAECAAEIQAEFATGPEPEVTFASVTPPAESTSTNLRYVPSRIRRAIWKRDGGACTYTDPQTGRRCRSRFGLQIDHVIPVAKGGRSVVTNLRLLCMIHNRLAASRALGPEIMRKYCNGTMG